MHFGDGQTLIQRIIATLGKVAEIEETYVYCSSRSISEMVESAGAKFLQRDPSLDLPTATSNDILSAFADTVDADVYVLAHATSPMLRAESIQRGVNAVIGETYDSALSVVGLHEFLWRDGKPINYDPSRIPRTQDLETWWAETSGFFAFTRQVLIEHGRRVGFNPFLVEVSKIEALDIDDAQDFAIASAVAQYQSGGDVAR